MTWKRLFGSVVAVSLVCLLSITQARAETNWSVDLGVGASATVGDISSRLRTGWDVDLRGGPAFDNGFGLFGEFTFNHLGVRDSVLQQLQVPNGTGRVFSLTAGPIWRFPIARMLHGYVLGSLGWYRRTVEFTAPTVGVIDVVDPWWGYIGPVVVPANQVLGSVSEDAFGANAGGGLLFPFGDSGASAFVEVRYHYARTTPTATTLVPVSFGLRFTGRQRSSSRP
ncbi:MAG TPA: hypothetical protein VG871_14155 [Vicinamibacterales bacterium]|nr:hypothetical protein [Vicinamibacterales bacterium]